MHGTQSAHTLFSAQLENVSKQNKKPSLLLHACCAPCSSYVLEYLNSVFDITLFFYNPNIFPEEEYVFRANELKRLVSEMGLIGSVNTVICDFDPVPFEEIAKGRESLPERSDRCTECYRLRLEKTYEYARNKNFDYFSTTLSISPHKDAERLNAIGSGLAAEEGPMWLYSDFKKKNGYKRSIELSEKYSLYRQNYCGCIYSKRAAK